MLTRLGPAQCEEAKCHEVHNAAESHTQFPLIQLASEMLQLLAQCHICQAPNGIETGHDNHDRAEHNSPCPRP